MSFAVAITGPSGSGKTFLSQQLGHRLELQLGQGAVAYLEQDAYYHCQNHVESALRSQTNYDHPDAFDNRLLTAHLQSLAQQHPIESPIYSYQHHTRINQTRAINPAQVILVDGILLLADKQLRQQFDLSLYVDTDIELCLERRVKRDSKERGRSPASVYAQFESTVKPMYQQHIEPSKRHADWVLSGQCVDDKAQLEQITARILGLLE